jgi:hypothetical protein
MSEPMNAERIALKIQALKKAAEDLQPEVKACPALDKNLERIVVSIKMLELNCSDLLDLELETLENGSA